MRTKRDWEVYLEAARCAPKTRETLRRALIWAAFHVHAPVSRAERDFATYVDTGEIGAMLINRRTRAIRDVNAFCDALDFDKWLRWNDTRKLDSIVSSVYGLSYAKASFALTCGGFARIPCLDVWALRHRLGIESRNWRTARAYLEDCKRAFGHRTPERVQWSFYWRLRNSAGRAFRRTSHAPFFTRIGISPLSRQLELV